MPRENEEQDQPGGQPIDYVKEALKWQYNIIGLIGAVGFAVVSGSELPLLLAAGLELMYVAVVPQSSRFRRLVRSWKFADEKRRHDERVRQMQLALPVEAKQQYRRLQEIAESIRKNFERLSSTSQTFLDPLESQLNGLLTSYLRLSSAADTLRHYIHTTDAGAILRELKSLEAGLAKDSEKVRGINAKRVEILTKRIERYGKIKENAEVIEAQSRAIADVLQLIRDQSLTMNDPHEVTDRLENLVKDVEQTEGTIHELEQIFQMSPEPDGMATELIDRLRGGVKE